MTPPDIELHRLMRNFRIAAAELSEYLDAHHLPSQRESIDDDADAKMAEAWQHVDEAWRLIREVEQPDSTEQSQ